MGLKLENAPDTDCEVWPANWQAVSVFLSLGTQWRLAPNGKAYGLDYGVLPSVLRMKAVPRSEWPELFEDMQTMEAEYLKESHRGRH